MNIYNLKINGKFIEEFVDTSIPQKFRGEWHNNTKQTSLKPIFSTNEEIKRIEGNRNLKSYFDMIFNIMQDNIYEIKKIEIIKVINERD